MTKLPVCRFGATALALALSFCTAAALARKTPKTRAPAARGDAAQGKAVYQQKCAMCHFAEKTENKMGPGMKGLFSGKELPSSHKPVTVANVREAIANGVKGAGPMSMPAFGEKLTKEQMENLIAYLRTL